VCVAHVILTNSHLLLRQKAILGKIFNNIFNWRLTVSQRERMWEIKNTDINHWLLAIAGLPTIEFKTMGLNTEEVWACTVARCLWY